MDNHRRFVGKHTTVTRRDCDVMNHERSWCSACHCAAVCPHGMFVDSSASEAGLGNGMYGDMIASEYAGEYGEWCNVRTDESVCGELWLSRRGGSMEVH
jgi:hypothetical protein